MNPKNLLPTPEQIKAVQGLEAELLQRRVKGKIAFLVGMGGALVQVATAIYNKQEYANGLDQLLKALRPANWSFYQVVGVVAIVLGFGIYFLYRRTSLLAKESSEPFQYTFWVEEFDEVTGTPGERFALESKDRLRLFHHDLMERLSLRIRRLSLLNVEVDVPEALRKNLTSHIHIKGNFAVRELKQNKWIVQIMPRIRIGPLGRPEVLAAPIKCDVPNHPIDQRLDADAYNQLVERVYSIVASEIYRQIRSDLGIKRKLFPTNYLRAVALYHEAVDFERSNTIDAYDYAIQLYRESKRHFDIRLWGGVSRLLARLPVVWRLSRKSLLADSGTRIGLSRSLIYRKVVSALSGRNQNVLFEVPTELDRVINNLTRLQDQMDCLRYPLSSFCEIAVWAKRQVRRLSPGYRPAKNKETGADKLGDEKGSIFKLNPAESEIGRNRTLMSFLEFPPDSIWKRNRRRFDALREMLASAYAVKALAYSNLGASLQAREFLLTAKAIDPILTQKSAIWFLAAAEVEPVIEKKLLLLNQANELEERFEIAQYRFAQVSEMKLLKRGEIQKERVETVINEYEQVLSTNPGNLGALLAQGYLYWLLGELDSAEEKLEQGCEAKSITRQVFVGEFFYALARTAIEKGEVNKAYDFYTQAIFSDPEVAAYAVVQSKRLIQNKHAFIGEAVLNRYERFLDKASEVLSVRSDDRKKSKEAKPSDKTRKIMLSFVLNECGNARLNYFARFGNLQILRKAVDAYKAAVKANRENAGAHYNLGFALGLLNYVCGWLVIPPENIRESFENAQKHAPTWVAGLINSVSSELERRQEETKRQKTDLQAKENELIAETLKALQQEKVEGLRGTPTDEAPIGQSPASEQKGVQELRAEVIRLREAVNDSALDPQGRFPRLVKNLMERTKWAFAFRALKVGYNGAGVDDLLSATIQRDRMDEDDIQVLEVWAKMLSTNEEPKALLASEKLYNYFLSYYPESHVPLNTLGSIYRVLAQPANYMLVPEDLKKPESISTKLCQDSKTYQYLLGKLPIERRIVIEEYRNSKLPREALDLALTDQLNYLIRDTSLQEGLDKELMVKPSKRAEPDTLRLNRMVLEKIFAEELAGAQTISKKQLAEYEKKRKHAQALLGEIIEDWLTSDPINYFSLDWAINTGAFDQKRQLIAIEKALKVLEYDAPGSESQVGANVRNGAHYALLGNYHYNYAQSSDQEVNKKELTASLEAYQKACEASPKEAVYFNALGFLFYSLADNVQAINAYKKAIHLAKDVQLYKSNLAQAYNSEGNSYFQKAEYVKAREFYEQAIECATETAIYHTNLGGALRELKDWDRAVEEIKKAIQLEPESLYHKSQLAHVHNARANESFTRGEYEAARDDYLIAIETSPQTAVFHSNLSIAFRRLKNWRNAEEQAEKALKYESNVPEYKRQLALVFNDEGVDYYDQANHLKAIEKYAKALTIFDGDDVIHSNLSLAWADLNGSDPENKNLDKAIAALQKAIDLKPDNSDYRKRMTDLQALKPTS